MCESFEEKLPKLSEKFNRNYYVKADTVNIRLLSNSGYAMLHRPYFAMKGSTHSAITLNPHTKVCIDAAPMSEQAICFQDFLKLFENGLFYAE
ncbi:MAG: hypothetical protein E7566_08500 [Ruminococcaceae bacterium]|nr:hypothetical protein [Oscillospiraceae bacterium]